jgi:hypothetical protein
MSGELPSPPVVDGAVVVHVSEDALQGSGHERACGIQSRMPLMKQTPSASQARLNGNRRANQARR